MHIYIYIYIYVSNIYIYEIYKFVDMYALLVTHTTLPFDV